MVRRCTALMLAGVLTLWASASAPAAHAQEDEDWTVINVPSAPFATPVLSEQRQWKVSIGDVTGGGTLHVLFATE